MVVKLSSKKRLEMRRHKQKNGPAKVRRRERRAHLQPISLQKFLEENPVTYVEELTYWFGETAEELRTRNAWRTDVHRFDLGMVDDDGQ